MAGLGSILNLLSIALLKAARERETIVLSCQGERFVIPVTPKKISVTDGQNNKVMNITQIGEILVFGMPKLQTISFSSFFPNPEKGYPFVVGDNRTPAECRALIKKWKEMRQPVRVIITSLDINLAVGIGAFDCERNDGTGDIYYSITFTEHKDLNTPLANNVAQITEATGLRERAGSVDATTATMTSKAADVLDVAKKAYGDYKHWKRVVEGNSLKDLAINNVTKIRKLKV